MENNAKNIFIEIEKEYSKSLPQNFIFKKIKYLIYLPLIIIGIVLSSIIYYHLEFYTNFFWLIYLIIIATTLIEIFFLNIYAKKQLKKIGINTNSSKLSNWNSSDFQKVRIFNFYNAIKESLILSKTDLSLNIKLLEEYQKYFFEKSKKKEWEIQIKGIATTILLFILPFWNLLAQDIIKSENKIPYELIFSVIVLIICIFTIRNQAIKLLDRDSYKYENISQLILNLKWNLELKNLN